ncbi:conserved Plasmodium protein, unknown function [Plasmodium knowlesi strain H]|uniref:Variable surface protein n=3 Tax=Plasmodium knowlesi TaxID=5850 RepID=A0A5K1VT11_PLAKH|nr:conserved Plasmodium protein, unknown function [Plasmodium knowlesi strain H]OTN64482.1 Uncharacterized protein PKNOH_S130185300 [Plasmodium knowlesi]CAA9989019.1 conserved Plasmodium protein, unknown function [Plasmodium knowlesi strain H]SBO24863.1 conserved Plasmodium protein, unknown function [Plasmodium knowlesi strain H]SBO27557.1 conserved Plasmodium protein, unknown function [Plasmodium knowlesi strain H]VVS78493.1 conserved Plasmodium protein, unknown function [Plasmodium knowlesi |eukprot:XP_002261367.1 hypothetical protein, conserved in Plasmodium species [Plasmodium knowlesi strain H]
MKKIAQRCFSPIVYALLLLYQKATKSSYVDVTVLNDNLFDDMIKTELSFMSNHLTFNDNNKSNRRKKRNDGAVDDLVLLTSMLSQIIPSNFSIYSLDIPNQVVSSASNDVNNFLDFINLYDTEINNTVTNHLNQTQPVKGCEDDIKNNNCGSDVLTCITLKKDKLSDTCKKSLSNSLLYSCIDDVVLYCEDYSKFSKVHNCLKKNFYQLSNKCLNILSYYENIMHKLHKIKNKPYNNQEHLFLEREKEGVTVGNSSNGNDRDNNTLDGKYNRSANDSRNGNNAKYNLLNDNGANRKSTMADNLRKGYGHYIFPSIDYNSLIDLKSRSIGYKSFLYFCVCLLIFFLLYILIICIKKYYVADSNNFFVKTEKTKLAQL